MAADTGGTASKVGAIITRLSAETSAAEIAVEHLLQEHWVPLCVSAKGEANSAGTNLENDQEATQERSTPEFVGMIEVSMAVLKSVI
jgi:hypothetical protein